MKSVLCLLAFILSSSAYAEITERTVLEQWAKQQSKTLLVLDAADAVTAYYKRKDPVFSSATFLALSCAEQSGQDDLMQIADVLMSASARRTLEQKISAIKVDNAELKKDGKQLAQEFQEQQQVTVQDFFRAQLEKVGASQTAADCYKVRVK